jgi:hypothetical protein
MNTEITAPNSEKSILCLANSRKLSGRCIAGREIVNDQPGPWIRPVSDRAHQEVSWEERHYQNGSDPRVLDVITVPLIEPRPHLFQQENWLLDPNFYWLTTGRVNWVELQAFVEPDGPLWVNGQSSYNGLNDRVILTEANQLRCSLRLIRVDRVRLRVFRPDPPGLQSHPKRKVIAEFEHSANHYTLSVTDPIYTTQYLAQQDGYYELGESCLTVSLGEPFNGYAYKLVAAIIERVQIETT